MSKFGCLAVWVLALAACSEPVDDADRAALGKNRQACSAQAYFAGLPRDEQLHYVFGGLHTRPQTPCIDDLVAAQDFSFIARLREEMVYRGGYYDRDLFLEVLARQASEGRLSAAQVRALELNGLCKADSGIEPDRCLQRIEKIEKAVADLTRLRPPR